MASTASISPYGSDRWVLCLSGCLPSRAADDLLDPLPVAFIFHVTKSEKRGPCRTAFWKLVTDSARACSAQT